MKIIKIVRRREGISLIKEERVLEMVVISRTKEVTIELVIRKEREK